MWSYFKILRSCVHVHLLLQAPAIMKVSIFHTTGGWLYPGSSIHVEFAEDTNMPRLDIPSSISLTPGELNDLGFYSVWGGPRTLLLFGSVRNMVNMQSRTPIHAKDVVLEFVKHEGKFN